jgi:hypothetical protein
MSEVNYDEDRFADANKALSALVNDDDFPDGPVERVEVSFMANGEVSWRVWEPRAEEARQGFYSAEQF